MPFVRYTTKRAARRAQRIWLLGAAEFAVLGSILSAVPNATFGALSSDVIATAMGYLAIEARNAVEDPPRGDYSRSTRARRRKLPVAELGDTALEGETAAFAAPSGYGAAYLAAFVRAVERSQMAEEVGAVGTAERRVAEADKYARRAAGSLRSASEHEDPLADELSADDLLREGARKEFRGPTGRDLLKMPYWDKFSRNMRQVFEEARLDPRVLLSDWAEHFPEDPVEVCAQTLRTAAESSQVLAFELEEWGPIPEKPRTPGLSES